MIFNFIELIKDLPMEYLKVFEKIGEEIGEFNDELIKVEPELTLIKDEAVDLLVTSTAHLFCSIKLSNLSLDQIKDDFVNFDKLTIESSDLNKNFQSFLSKYGKVAKAQRKFRKDENDLVLKYNLIKSSFQLTQQAFLLNLSINSILEIENHFLKKVKKWRSYAYKPDYK